jgi:DNA-binding beta-propeller fold protein YncE
MRRVFVQHTYGLDVAAFDQDDGFRELGRIALGAKWKPDSIALSKDQSLLYTNWSDLAWHEASYRGGARSKFTAHDAKTLAPVWEIDLDSAIQHFAYDPTQRYFYNAVMERPRVIRVDVDTREAAYIAAPVLGGHKVRVSADGRFCYVGSMLSGALMEFSCADAKFTRLAQFPDFVRPFVLTRDGRTAYVQLSRRHSIVVFDIAEWRIVGEVELPPLPADTPVEAEWPATVDHGLELTKDGQFLLSLATTGNYLAVFEHPSLKLIKTVPLGEEPSYLAFNPEGDRLYITNRVSGGVIVLSVPDFEIVAQLKHTGNRPQRICVASAGS